MFKRFAGFLAVATVALAATAGSAMADVYTLTGTAYGNAVAVFDRAGNGTLEPAGSVLTGGSGVPSGGQGALALDHNQLVAVNAGTNTVSLFGIDGHGPGLRDVEPSGGVSPLSATIHGRLVYVLNSAGTANITGFFLWHDRLVPVPNSTRALSAAAPGPAQVQFSPDGRTLVVTEKNTNRIDTLRRRHRRHPEQPDRLRVCRRHAVRLCLRQARPDLRVRGDARRRVRRTRSRTTGPFPRSARPSSTIRRRRAGSR